MKIDTPQIEKTIELEHATDTTIARSSAGQVTVEGAPVALEGYTTTATAAGTTTLTVASTRQQYFTGATTQTVTLPVASTLVLGQTFLVRNLSTGIVTVNSSGANVVLAIPALTTAIFTCILTSGTTAASWSVSSYLNTPASAGGSAIAFDPSGTTYHASAFPFIGTLSTEGQSGRPGGWSMSGVDTTDSSGSLWNVGYASILSNTATCVMNTVIQSGKVGTANNKANFADAKKVYYAVKVRSGATSGTKRFGLGTGVNAAWYDDTNTSGTYAMFSDAAGTYKAQNCNGATQTSTTITCTNTNNNYFQIILNLSTNITFYRNGTLVATHTTNLPTTGDLKVGYGMDTSAQNIYTTQPLVSVEL